MSQTFRIARLKRTYSRWVADETMEDCALRFTAYRVRRFSPGRIANTAIGAVSFLALEAIGGAITLSFGFSNALAAILVTSCLIFLAALPISWHAARAGVDVDLLTRGAGFGYLGSTLTSLIYASFTFIFFAIEAAIVATALKLTLGMPLWLGYIVSSLGVIPLVLYGITFISRFQAWTQPIWIVLQLAPFVFIAANGFQPVSNWTGYTGLYGALDGGVGIAAFGAASAVLFSLIAQIGEQVDYLRFLPKRSKIGHLNWWVAMVSAGPGWIVIGALKILAGSFLAYYAFANGTGFGEASDPVYMYHTVFSQMVSTPELALGLTGIFIVICQAKINVTNAYAGSIAWSNFFSRLTHNHPGRVVWLVFNVLISLLLMEFGMYRAFEHILGLYSILAVAWVSALVADLVINKPLGLSPKEIEFRRAHLYDINPVGFGAMMIGIGVSIASYFGLLGSSAEALYSYVAIAVTFLVAPLLAFLTEGRYYLARQPDPTVSAPGLKTCCICEYSYDGEDMAHCPVYSGPICSLCCSLDARCGDGCKPQGRLGAQMHGAVSKLAFHHENVERWLGSTLARYLGIMACTAIVMAIVFVFASFDGQLNGSLGNAATDTLLLKLYAIMMIAAGVIVWLVVLAQDSHSRAEEEVRRHTGLLIDEIAAHRETDRQLQQAKEVAEKANLAKSRYVVGLSHELRTPLNAILGYAQLLERQAQPETPVGNAARTIKKSGDHLTLMIDGLLDISRIEAGKLEIFRHKVALKPLLDQLIDMFSLQAANKNVAFIFEPPATLPDYVWTDGKRLRQILINLLSNAVKFTREGDVRFSVAYRNQIAVFTIADTGIGIAPEDLERVFLPFERAAEGVDQYAAPGTGLGLAITRLLVDIMGADLSVQSELDVGTTFTLRIMLGSAHKGEEIQVQQPLPKGYVGCRRRILVADDNSNHRAVTREFLEPIGFEVIEAVDGRSAMSAAAISPVDLALLDVAMPHMDGWQVARRLRASDPDLPIVMISAEAGPERNRPEYQALYNSYLTKPFSFADLIEALGTLLSLQWTNESEEARWLAASESWTWPSDERIRELEKLARTGFLRSLVAVLREIEQRDPDLKAFCDTIRDLAERGRADTILTILARAPADLVQ
ncbi:ATP-binding protein [Notoacmeibacter sp. MSK16QG-6]|uniref:hybrid sensor histidine kinase/response regulator n=1 Tax=Notoacmeibacter sp. MSK16QG-6 TaxID=2957982 RepID=UPI00209FA39E|nr:ATP-binding protein [Notoacmeibacter sp. MSK16QG-6]MCP1200840.1 ATP-binding protein [Notoacmeibacter sp. MSK16QG-6]